MFVDYYERERRLQKVKNCIESYDPVKTALKRAPIDGYDFREISDIMCIHYETVRTTFIRAMKKLKSNCGNFEILKGDYLS